MSSAFRANPPVGVRGRGLVVSGGGNPGKASRCLPARRSTGWPCGSRAGWPTAPPPASAASRPPARTPPPTRCRSTAPTPGAAARGRSDPRPTLAQQGFAPPACQPWAAGVRAAGGGDAKAPFEGARAVRAAGAGEVEPVQAGVAGGGQDGPGDAPLVPGELVAVGAPAGRRPVFRPPRPGIARRPGRGGGPARGRRGRPGTRLGRGPGRRGRSRRPVGAGASRQKGLLEGAGLKGTVLPGNRLAEVPTPWWRSGKTSRTIPAP